MAFPGRSLRPQRCLALFVQPSTDKASCRRGGPRKRDAWPAGGLSSRPYRCLWRRQRWTAGAVFLLPSIRPARGETTAGDCRRLPLCPHGTPCQAMRILPLHIVLVRGRESACKGRISPPSGCPRPTPSFAWSRCRVGSDALASPKAHRQRTTGTALQIPGRPPCFGEALTHGARRGKAGIQRRVIKAPVQSQGLFHGQSRRPIGPRQRRTTTGKPFVQAIPKAGMAGP